MKHWREASYPTEKPDAPGTYFAVWEVGDTHWHGAAIWNGTSWEPEIQVPALKGVQPTYWLKRYVWLTRKKLDRYTNQSISATNLDIELNGEEVL